MARKAEALVVIRGKNETQQAFKEFNASLESMNAKLATAGKAVVGAFSLSALTNAVRGIAAASDNYNLMNARLKLATESQEQFNTAQSELRNIAASTQTPLASLVTLYGRISRPLKEAGRSQSDILKVTEAVATSFRVSGASAQEAENGVIQFAQALGSGALRGDEFNSVAEQAPRLMQALADSIGVPVGALKEMASQGLLTASVVTDALVGQLDTLRAEAATLPETVGGAMTALSDRWNEAIGKADTQPLIEAIKQLGETLSDPVVVDNLVMLASALATLAGTATEGASEFVDLGKRIAFIAANSQGLVTELDQVDQQIADLDRSLSGKGLSTTLDGLLFSDDELRKKRAALAAFRAAIVEEQTGMNAELEFLAEVGAAAADAGRQKEIDARTRYIGELKRLQGEQVKAAENQAKALVGAEKKANADLEKVRKERQDIEKRYSTALSELGGAGDASFGLANDLKVGARKALADGDIEGAQSKARAALKTLQDLAAAGENTYGFEGFIKELQAIDLAANDIEQSNAQAKIDQIKESMAALKLEGEKLKDMPVSVKADDASIEAVRTQIQALAAELGNTQIVLPVRVASPSGDAQAPQQFATGGHVRGPGSGTSDSIPALLSNGEYVIRAAAVRKLGKGYLDLINNGIPLRRFADGGMVESVAEMATGPSFPELGSLSINMGGEQVNVYASPGDALNIQRLARKFGHKK